MTKVDDIAKISTRGSFHMLWGLVVSTVIMAAGSILIARLLGSELYGLYTIVLMAPMVIMNFRDWGISTAMIKFTAQYRVEGRLDEIRNLYITGILFEIIAGLALSVFSFFFADFLATNVFHRPEIAPLIQIVSFSITAGGLVTAATAVFTGYERLELTSVMLIVQSTAKTAIMIALVISGFSTAGAAIGYTAGSFIAGIVGLGLIGVIYRQLPKAASHKLEIKAYLTSMLTYCLPLSLATIIYTLLPQFYSFLLPIHYTTDNIIIGNYGVALNFVILITFFVLPITTTMFPAFSKMDPEKDKESLRNVFRFSVKYGSLFVVPVTTLVMCLSGPAVATLFGHTYETAALFLSLLAIQYLYIAFGTQSLNALLLGQGQTSLAFRMALLTGAIGFSVGYALIMIFGVFGLIVTTLVSSVPSLIIGLIFIKRTYGMTVDWKSSIRILLSSAIAGAVTYLAVSELAFAAYIQLIIGVLLFVAIFVTAILLSRSITKMDITNLQLMAGGIGGLGRVINKLLSLLKRLMTLMRL